MGKKILVLSGSPRKGGNSDYLCDRFIAGAQEAGHEAVKIFISGKKVGYCRACYACKNTGKCVQKDDMEEILAKMLAADVLVLASPVYFYSIDAQIKTVLDRTPLMAPATPAPLQDTEEQKKAKELAESAKDEINNEAKNL